MSYKKIICSLLLSVLWGNMSTFVIASVTETQKTAPQIPKSDRILQDGDTVSILPKDHSYIGIYIGGALALAGLALIIYGKIQRSNLDSDLEKAKNKGLNATELEAHVLKALTRSIEKDMEYYEGYYWGGGTLGAIGLITLLISLGIKYKNQSPLAMLNALGITSDGKHLEWTKLDHAQEKTKFSTYQDHSSSTHTVSTNNGLHTITVNTPKTTIVREEVLELIPRNSFCITKPDKNIEILIERLPIPEHEFVKLLENYRDVYGTEK